MAQFVEKNTLSKITKFLLISVKIFQYNKQVPFNCILPILMLKIVFCHKRQFFGQLL